MQQYGPPPGYGAPPQQSRGGRLGSLAVRLVTAVLAAIVMALFVFVLWGVMVGMIGASGVAGKHSDLVVYPSLVLIPGGAVVAALAAFVTGIWPYGKLPWLRWLILPAVFVVLGFVVFGLLAFVVAQGK